MARVVSVNVWQVLPAFLLLQAGLAVEGRRVFSTESHVYHPREDTDFQTKILALLLHKSFVPVERKDALDLDLANRLAELEQLEDIQLGKGLSSQALVEDKPVQRKRNEPCFWKYCV